MKLGTRTDCVLNVKSALANFPPEFYTLWPGWNLLCNRNKISARAETRLVIGPWEHQISKGLTISQCVSRQKHCCFYCSPLNFLPPKNCHLASLVPQVWVLRWIKSGKKQQLTQKRKRKRKKNRRKYIKETLLNTKTKFIQAYYPSRVFSPTRTISWQFSSRHVFNLSQSKTEKF